MFKNLLTKPYPFSRGWKKETLWLVVTFLGAGSILLIFKPFGLAVLPTTISNHFIWLVLLVLFIFDVLMNVVSKPLLAEKVDQNWTVAKEITWLFFYLMAIALLIYSVALYSNITQLSWLDAFTFIIVTLLASLIPISFTVLLKQNWLLKRTLISLEQLPQSSTSDHSSSLITLQGSANESCSLDSSDLLFIKAQQNYAEIVYLKAGIVEKVLLRSSLSSMAKQLPDLSIIKCHRSYLVNLASIKSLSGNAQGYQLKLIVNVEPIPVSRSFIAAFNTAWKAFCQ